MKTKLGWAVEIERGGRDDVSLLWSARGNNPDLVR